MKTTLSTKLVAFAMALAIVATAVLAVTATPAPHGQETASASSPVMAQVEIVGKRMNSVEKNSFDAEVRTGDAPARTAAN